jgi:hypothetical protein
MQWCGGLSIGALPEVLDAAHCIDGDRTTTLTKCGRFCSKGKDRELGHTASDSERAVMCVSC